MGSFFINKVTIYHIGDEEATRMQFDGVYFRHDISYSNIQIGEAKSSVGTITIPTTDTLSISEGDYVIEGLIDDEWDLRKLMKTYKIYRVYKIHDNRKGGLKHYKLEVSE